jgi:hypothetical protein
MDPIFVGGTGRSGTTLFVDLLGSHPRIAPFYEPWFLIDVATEIFVKREESATSRLANIRQRVAEWSRDIAALPHNKKDYERYRHGSHCISVSRQALLVETDKLCQRLLNEQALPAYRGYVEAVAAIHAGALGKPHWAIKVPRLITMVALLIQAFPTMKFFHLIRDPRHAIPSMQTRDWSPRKLGTAIPFWREHIEIGRRFAARHPDAYREVRYEDLTGDPQGTMAKVFDWLGVAESGTEVVADYVRQFPIAAGGVPGRDLLGPEECRQVEAELGDLMRHFGYL